MRSDRHDRYDRRIRAIWTILALATFFMLILVLGILLSDYLEGGL